MKKGYSETGTLIIISVVIAVIAIGVWVMMSHFEASAFNAVTGKNVSTWQAMWIRLRVQEGISKD